MSTKTKPGKFDGHVRAEPDEPVFTLSARDESAPMLVRTWAELRMIMVRLGVRPKEDQAKAYEAMEIAEQMVKWKREHDRRRTP